MLTPPDLLHLEPRLDIDRELVEELLEMAFLGRDSGPELDAALASGTSGGWRPEFFARDLFLRELVGTIFSVSVRGRSYSTHRDFLVRVLSSPPRSREAIAYRQEIVRELEENDEIRRRFEDLYVSLRDLLERLRLPGQSARLDINTYRLEVLEHAKRVVDTMASGFTGATSALARLSEAGEAIRASPEYGLLAAMVDWEQRMATLRVGLDVGAAGRITRVEVEDLRENEGNLFYSGPWKRLRQRLSFLVRGYKWDSASVLSRLIHQVFLKLRPSLTPLVQLVGQMEIYLANRGFRRLAEENGLAVTLASFDPAAPVAFASLFNPLLLGEGSPPVPCDLGARPADSVTLLTGPNSGGKTRLLQAVGLAQVLGQNGLYVAARRAELAPMQGIYVSLVEQETAGQSEGRLGRELLRIRRMFESIDVPSLVVLDELCSGTNPSEGIEVFSLVLELLDRVSPFALISTHFLDHARELERRPPITGLEFLQVEVDEAQRSTYQFVPGVAETSLAALMAKRLGVTQEELAATIERRLAAVATDSDARRGGAGGSTSRTDPPDEERRSVPEVE